MLKYAVRYEIEAQPSNVIMEIICASKEEAERLMEERVGRKNLKIIEVK